MNTVPCFEEIEFDQSDCDLFGVDDRRLKADAIRHSILPRMHQSINHAMFQRW